MRDPTHPPTKRRSESPWRLARAAAGPVAGFPGKLARFGRTVAAYGGRAEIDRRLEKLRALGVIDEIPSKVQLAVGSWDMLRFWIAPASADYYREQGIDFGFHQVLRFLDEPASLADPLGLMSTRDAIIGHLMQVVHASAVYDLELLRIFDDGLTELESQVEAMIAGTHPRASQIGAIVEDATYHERLLGYVREFRAAVARPSLKRSNVVASEHFTALERTFGSMTTAFRYFCRLPRDVPGALRHVRVVTSFPFELGEPAPADAVTLGR